MSIVDELELDWGEGRDVQTSQGPRYLKKAEPDHHFWKLWRHTPGAKEELKAAGISVTKETQGLNQGLFMVCWWQHPENVRIEYDPVVAKKNAEAIRAKSRKNLGGNGPRENAEAANYQPTDVIEQMDGTIF